MRRLILLILACAILLPSLAQAYDVLVLQSRRDAAYEEALKGFNAASSVSKRVLVLSDFAELDIVRIVREDRPRGILAVGDAALSVSRKIRQTPVISLMALGVHNRTTQSSNLFGVGMYAAPEQYLNLFRQMKARRVGIVHNPDKSGRYLREARLAARRMGVELVIREVASPRETLSKLHSLAGKIDLLWMLPDTTAVTRETAEGYFRFAQENKIPLVSFANAYLGLGAAAVLDLDRAELGKQAAEIASVILDGENADDPETVYPRRCSLKTNPAILRNLGIMISSND